MTIKKIAAIASILILSIGLINCKKTVSDSNLRELGDKMYKYYDEYFRSIEENLSNPEAAIKAGEDYINRMTPELKGFGEKFGKVYYKRSQEYIMKEIKQKISTRSSEAGSNIGRAFGLKRDLLAKFREQIMKLTQLMAKTRKRANTQTQ